VNFTSVETPNGIIEINTDTAIDQLERYKIVMENYVDSNCSITVSYSPEEVPAIVDWLDENWDTYVGVSFLYRNDPTKTPQDLGYEYLPQEVKTKQEYLDYAGQLLPVDIDSNSHSFDELVDEQGCTGGMCPVK
jgi:ribonucleoside-triphosphate reductase